MKKILVIAGGGKKHLEPFLKEAENQKVDLTTASFSELEYETKSSGILLKVRLDKVSDFRVIYIRLVGKRYEDAALLVSYARKHKIKIVDSIYEKSEFIRLPLAKSLETKLLLEAGLPVPKTLFASLNGIKEKAPSLFGFPFVIKGTVGKQGHAVWSPRNDKEMNETVKELAIREKRGERFLAQEFIRAGQRNRVLVIGERAVAAITRPTRWRRRFIKKVDGEYPEGVREALKPIPEEDASLALKACRALSIDIGGVDIIHEDKTDKPFVLEVNSAPRWESIKKDTKVNVEREILKFLARL